MVIKRNIGEDFFLLSQREILAFSKTWRKMKAHAEPELPRSYALIKAQFFH